ncbi:flagellar basal-body rod modification protein FlgD [Virgibacillus subterraneus]|uniref:Flagellar basal-body rod modification protein FlgD n=2 Tax=Virgibacillus TaxID=84406 RepID=A0A1H1C8U3_9BACI|nr:MULTISPECIES: flagellar hook assembly protein FlgD [Virgibacillus]SDQ60592.1 flagellar basal-body rod modification protein FlgD [Virgibacillus salinus]SEQ58188.1 flagellar basal-body rod modification protein FlgD [Virgibacillus subterraneus]
MTTIDPSLYLNNQSTERVPSPDLGKDEFLKILMTQLQNQDPTNPMKDQEFVSQMASFSSLEQMMNMTNSIDNLVQNQTVSPILKNSHMIGKEVSYQAYDEETGEKIGIETSKVTAVSQDQGWAVLELENGEKIYADSITQVSDPDASSDSGTEENVTGPSPEGSE